MFIEQLAQVFAPWQSAYDGSIPLSTTVQAVHLVSLLFGGGLAVAADRATLRAGGEASNRRGPQLVELRATHRPVLIALGILFLSGIALAAADIETFASSPTFWVKLGLVGLLVTNGAFLERTESALRRLTGTDVPQASPIRIDRLWHRLRVASMSSIALWTLTLIAGVVLTNAA